MSISDNYVPINQQGDGATVDYSDNWAMINANYFLGFLELISTGVRTPIVVGTDGTLIFDNSGFTFTFNVAPSNLYNVIIGRDVSLDQGSPYRTAKGFQGAVIENSFDKLTAICQDLRDGVNRSLQFPLGSDVGTIGLPIPVANTVLGWNSDGTALINIPEAESSALQAAASAAAAAASAASIDVARIPYKDTTNAYTHQQYNAAIALTDGASIAWNVDTAPSAKLAIAGNHTLAAPSNLKDGATYILRVQQDATGGRTLAYNVVFKWPGGVAPVLSTTANAIDILTFTSDGTNLYGVIQKAFA